MVLVDWTGAGRGARLASLDVLLQCAEPRYAAGVMRGYREYQELTAEVLGRLGGVLWNQAVSAPGGTAVAGSRSSSAAAGVNRGGQRGRRPARISGAGGSRSRQRGRGLTAAAPNLRCRRSGWRCGGAGRCRRPRRRWR